MIRLRDFNWRRLLAILVALFAVAAAILIPLWRSAIDRNLHRQIAEPFRIAGNLFYVGGSDSSSFLITGPDGDVLIDSGRAGTADMIVTSITKLGFDIRDVKVLLNSAPRGDHAGALADLQQASGAQLWASEASAPVLAAGGDDPDFFFPIRFLVRSGLLRYPAPRVDHQFKDGETIRLGTTSVTAHITAGYTRGCTSYSFQVRDAKRLLNVVSACSFGAVEVSRYAEQAADLKNSIRVLRSLPADIWVTSQLVVWNGYFKLLGRATAKNAADPFIDPEGYRSYIDAGETRYLRDLVK